MVRFDIRRGTDGASANAVILNVEIGLHQTSLFEHKRERVLTAQFEWKVLAGQAEVGAGFGQFGVAPLRDQQVQRS